jgi:sec-independent protein translocase protein TatC
MSEKSAGAEDDKEQSLISHLLELRNRLLKAVASIGVVFIALLPFGNKIYTQLAQPLLRKLPLGGQMIATDPASPFFVPMKLAFFAAVVICAPVVLYQAWAFVAPGLYKHEKKLALPLLISSTLLFYLGCAFAYFLVLPAVFSFMTKVAPIGVAVMTDITKYLDFVLVIFICFGAMFEVPIAVIIMVQMGWISIAQLREYRGYVIVGIFIVAAIVTPPDMVSQLMLALPMMVLYEVGILAAQWLARPRKVVDASTPT